GRVCRGAGAKPGNPRGISFPAADRRRRGRYVHGAGSDRRRPCRLAEPGFVRRHGHVLAGRPGAGRSGGNHCHGQLGGEAVAGRGAARCRRTTVNWDWFALAFAMIYPSCMSWIYFVALATENGKVNPLVPVVYGAGKVVQFAFPAIYTWFFNRED